MRFDVITLFPELFEPFLAHGINRRAFESGQVEVHFWNIWKEKYFQEWLPWHSNTHPIQSKKAASQTKQPFLCS